MTPAPSAARQAIELRHGLFLTVGEDPKDASKWLAIISDGSPQYGHSPVTVLTLNVFDTKAQAIEWFNRMKVEQPWIKRQ